MSAPRTWLLKSEPETYSIADLQKDGTTWWEGVRNYQARNFMMQEMQVGDQIFFYHSNAEPPGLAGLAVVSAPAQPDRTQFDPKSDFFDPKSTKSAPRWFCVQVRFVRDFRNLIPLSTLKQDKRLKDLLLLQRGQRLSVQPVPPKHAQILLQLAGE